MSWKQTRSGLAIALDDPDLSTLDLVMDVAVPLSLICRFDGHASDSQALGYSVAQHCCLGADALLQETGGDTDAAIAFLMHDWHEAFCGDITTPVADGLDRLAVDAGGLPAPGTVRRAIEAMKGRLDAALYRRVGIPWPLPLHRAELVADMDLRLLRRERDELMLAPPKPWSDRIENAEPIACLDRTAFQSWSATEAQERLISRLLAWHPDNRHLALRPWGLS